MIKTDQTAPVQRTHKVYSKKQTYSKFTVLNDKENHGLSWNYVCFVLIQQCEPRMFTFSLWPLVSASGGGKYQLPSDVAHDGVVA